MPDTVRKANLMIISGFLGSGKTTAMIAIAKHLMAEGKRVGVIVNDYDSSQADLQYLRRKGFDAEAVMGGCLNDCMEEFVQKLQELNGRGGFDFILVEPSGSCIGLTHTFHRLKNESGFDEYELMPLVVLVDPARLLTEFLNRENHLALEAETLLLKQMEEADIIVVNKADTLSKVDMQEIDTFLRERYDTKTILFMNATLNSGIDILLGKMELIGVNKKEYDSQYPDMESKHYWKLDQKLNCLNLNCEFTINNKISGNYLLSSLADKIKESLKAQAQELVYLKIYLESGYAICRLSCIGVEEENSFDKKISVPIGTGKLLIHVRAAALPEQLKQITKSAMESVLQEEQGAYANMEWEEIP